MKIYKGSLQFYLFAKIIVWSGFVILNLLWTH